MAPPERPRSSTGRLGVAMLLAVATYSCSGDPTFGDPDSPTGGAAAPSGVPATGTLLSSPIPSALLAGGGSRAGSVVFVSGAPSSAPGASSVLAIGGAADTTVAVVSREGFDPVPVAGAEGQAVTVIVTDTAGRTTTHVLDVKRRAPRVVRTSPAPTATDVPLNIRATVVFTAPLDSASAATGVALFTGSVEVPGTVQLSTDGLALDFTPAAPLAPSSDYVLRVAPTLRDVLGTAIGEQVSIGFRTGMTPLPTGRLELSPISIPWSGSVGAGQEFGFFVGFPSSDPEWYALPIRWTISDPSVVAIYRGDANAYFRALRPGSVTIRAEVNGVAGETQVTVVAASSLRLSISVAGADQDTAFTVEDLGACWSGGGSFEDECRRYPVRPGLNELSMGPGSRIVQLHDVEANCVVSGGTSRDVTIVAGSAVDVNLAVTCTALPPVSLRISALATGSPAPAGYYAQTGAHGECNVTPCVLTWDAGSSVEVRALPGTREIRLFAPFACSVVGANPAVVDIAAGVVTDLVLQVHCTPPGNVRVTVSMTGGPGNGDLLAYSRPCATGQVWDNCFSQLVPGSGTLISGPLIAGTRHDIWLSSLPLDCRVVGANPVPVTITSAATSDVSFEVRCE